MYMINDTDDDLIPDAMCRDDRSNAGFTSGKNDQGQEGKEGRSNAQMPVVDYLGLLKLPTSH